jgi:hypothetical protein
VTTLLGCSEDDSAAAINLARILPASSDVPAAGFSPAPTAIYAPKGCEKFPAAPQASRSGAFQAELILAPDEPGNQTNSYANRPDDASASAVHVAAFYDALALHLARLLSCSGPDFLTEKFCLPADDGD